MRKLEINLELIEELKNIKWLENIGRKIEIAELYPMKKEIVFHMNKVEKKVFPISIKTINSYDNFIQSLKSIEWENTTLEIENLLTVYLNDKYNKEYQEWNKIVKIATEYYENDIKSTINLNNILKEDKETIIQDIRWNIMGILLENSYANLKKESYFKYVIFEIYKNGHIPCGWEGEFPNGKLLIY